MAFLDATVVAVALPVMQRELSMSVGLAQWVVEAYALMLASLVLVGGALGDRLGRSRVYLVGVALFALASAACGLAPDALVLVAARAVQGVGAALLVPGSLSLISAAYDDTTRGAAIGTWSAFSAITGAVGPVAGGWVVAHASWRWLFFFNVPSLRWSSRSRVATSSRRATTRRRRRWTGPAPRWRRWVWAWWSTRSWTRPTPRVHGAWCRCSSLGLLTLVAFVVVEARGRAPMVHLSLFRSRTFAGTNLLTLLLYAALGGAFFFLPFDLIQVQGYSPAAAGAALLPFVLLLAAMSRCDGGAGGAPRERGRCWWWAPWVPRRGSRCWRGRPSVDRTGARSSRPSSSSAWGWGVTVAPLTAAVMGAVESRHAGVASGINNAVARAAGLLAIAALGVMLTSRFDAVLDLRLAAMALPPSVSAVVEAERGKLAGANLSAVMDPAVRASLRAALFDAYVAAFREAMLVCAGLAAVGAVVAGVLVDGKALNLAPGPRRRAPPPD